MPSTVARFTSEVEHDDRERHARQAIGTMMRAYGICDSRLDAMARMPITRSCVREMAMLMANALRDSERIAAVCAPDPMAMVGTNRGL